MGANLVILLKKMLLKLLQMKECHIIEILLQKETYLLSLQSNGQHQAHLPKNKLTFLLKLFHQKQLYQIFQRMQKKLYWKHMMKIDMKINIDIMVMDIMKLMMKMMTMKEVILKHVFTNNSFLYSLYYTLFFRNYTIL